MKFDNSPSVIKIQMQKRLFALIIATVLALIFTTKLWDHVENFTGITKVDITIIFVAVFVLFYIYHVVAASSFISYNDEEGKIIVRFYQLNMFNTDKNSFEIPFKEFAGYRVEHKLLKIRENMVLFRKYQGNIVRYPPFSISALPKDQKSQLLKSLNQLAPKE